MSLRAWLAGMAMQGLIAACGDINGNATYDEEALATSAVNAADALIAELEKDKP